MKLSPLFTAIAAVALIVLVAILAPEEAARGWRTGFLVASAPAIGAVLLIAIATLTGALWQSFGRLVAPMPLLVIAAIGIGVIQLAPVIPEHLQLWQSPLLAGIRAVIAVTLLAFAGTRLERGAGQGFAGVTLALYAAFVTPIASDWLLGGDPGHAVSAAGMMLFVEQIGGACAALLALGWGDTRMRQDMAKLLVAAALGLSYLTFMDYLILWYGDLPSRAGWYVVRGTLPMALLAGAALLLGLVAPVAALALRPGEVGRRIAGWCALAGLALFNLWWVGGGLFAALVALAAILLAGATAMLFERRSAAYG